MSQMFLALRTVPLMVADMHNKILVFAFARNECLKCVKSLGKVAQCDIFEVSLGSQRSRISGFLYFGRHVW